MTSDELDNAAMQSLVGRRVVRVEGPVLHLDDGSDVVLELEPGVVGLAQLVGTMITSASAGELRFTTSPPAEADSKEAH